MNLPDLWTHLRDYLALAACGLAIGTAAGLPLGILASSVPASRGVVLTLANVARAIPSLAVLTFMLPILGVGFVPAIVALGILATPPIAINTDLGLRSVPFSVIDAARGMGMSARESFWRVQWPLGFPVAFTGVRTAATEVCASAVLAAFIGAGGLGEYITTGLQANEPSILWKGIVAIALVVLLAEFALAIVQRKVEVRA